MSRDFDQFHKNLELLRFYIARDIKRIYTRIDNNESTMMSFFYASFVDILVVVFFDDLVKNFIKAHITNAVFRILILCLCILLLLILFLVIKRVYMCIVKKRKQKLVESGEYAYMLKPEERESIDDFDNMACDGLLICQSYIQKYKLESEPYVKEFYYYEVVHHLEKARRVFVGIYNNRSIYIASKDNNYNSQLIDSYRINNFIRFYKKIYLFLIAHKADVITNADLIKDLKNLKASIKTWKPIE